MTDLEMTKLCAQAMGGTPGVQNSLPLFVGFPMKDAGGAYDWVDYEPLTNDAQAMALVKKFDLCIDVRGEPQKYIVWPPSGRSERVRSDDLNRAIVECVARLTAK